VLLLPIVIMVVAQVKPGPLDAFLANYSSIKAEMDFEYVDGQSVGKAADVWMERKPAFRENRASKIVGHWACDGETESYCFRSSDEMLEQAEKNKPRREASKMIFPAHYVPWTEALWDGHILAWHTRDPIRDTAGRSFSSWAIHVGPVHEEPDCLTEGRGPFYWGFSYTFPQIVKAKFPGFVPTRRKSTRGGHPVEVEIYQEAYPGGGWFRFEVSYDPALGYLPRFARIVSLSSMDSALGKEMYLAEAKPCAAGGFVPTEWFGTFISVDRFSTRFPDYNDDTVLQPEQEFRGGHFQAAGFKDRSSPVALTDLKGVTTLNTPGGWLPLRKTGSLTLPMIRQAAGNNLTNPSKRRVLPSLDATELHQFDPPEPSGSQSTIWWALTVIGVALVSYLGWHWNARRRSTLVIILVSAFVTSGCGISASPVVKLNAAFKDTSVFVDPEAADLAMSLLLRNDGNQPLRLFKADGGCSCRRVDQSLLPCVLSPGAQMSLPVAMTAPRATSPQNAGFEFETDHGVLSVNIPYFSLVSHQFDPDAATHTALKEDDSWAFEFTHREIYRGDGPKPHIDLVFPEEFSAERVSTQGGAIGAAPGFLFEDRKYAVRLISREFGLHKAYITLRQPNGGAILEAPVVWNRLPFLSTIPERVTLGARPARVFLRCPDDSVEITRVLAKPEGISALVASPRELRVSLAVDAAAVIDGILEIGTTAANRPPLRIRVVRYSPGG